MHNLTFFRFSYKLRVKPHVYLSRTSPIEAVVWSITSAYAYTETSGWIEIVSELPGIRWSKVIDQNNECMGYALHRHGIETASYLIAPDETKGADYYGLADTWVCFPERIPDRCETESRLRALVNFNCPS